MVRLNSSAYKIYCSLFPDELLVLLVDKTNRYYNQTIDALGGQDNLPQCSRLCNWTPVDLPCMKAFLAILILIGIDQCNSYELYWTMNDYLTIPFVKKLMSNNCFMLFLRCLHLSCLCDNIKLDGTVRRAKINPVLNILVAAWQAAYYPNGEICIDESMITFKGRMEVMVYQPKKPHKWGCWRAS